MDNLFCEVNENIKAYGVASHRHTPEIEEQLGYACGQKVLLNFTPHLIPMNRGILITAYASLTKKVSYEEVRLHMINIMRRKPLSAYWSVTYVHRQNGWKE